MKKKIISAILVVILGCTPLAVVNTSADTKADNYKQQISKLQQQEKKYQEELRKTQGDIKKKEAYSESLVGQIGVLSEEIGAYHQQITQLSSDISQKQRDINKAKRDIDKQMDSLGTRIREIYMAGDTSDIDIILGAKNFSDFLDKYELIKVLSDYDKKLIDKIEGKLEVISKEKAELVEDRKVLEASEEELRKKQSKLNGLLKENEEVLAGLYKDKNDAQSHIKKTNAMQSEVERQLQAYYDSQRSINNNSGTPGTPANPASPGSITISKSGFAWPVPGFNWVGSPYGEDRGYSHKGIDIIGGGIMGAAVVAAQSGTVVTANNSCSHNWGKSGSCGCGGGFGNYVLIDHGNGKSTLYGHLTSAAVTAGSSVSRGQTIGYVGSTGWSTGAHLHFETRSNGATYNPMLEY